MDNNEPKLDGYEPMNMSQIPSEEPQPIMTETTPVETIETIDQTANISANEPVPEQVTPIHANPEEQVGEQPLEQPAVPIIEPVQTVQPEVIAPIIDETPVAAPVTTPEPIIDETPVAAPVVTSEPIITSQPEIQNQTVETVNPVSSTTVEQPSGITFTQPVQPEPVTNIPTINTPISEPLTEEKPKKNKLPIIIAAVVAVIALAVGAYFLLFKKASDPHEITTNIFDEVASSTLAAYDEFSAIIAPSNGKKQQSTVDLTIEDMFSLSLVECMDVANQLAKLNAKLIYNGDLLNVNGVVTKDAIYFNFDEDFGNNYKYNYDLSSLFELSNSKEENRKMIEKVLDAFKKSYTDTFKKDDFEESKSDTLTKYTLKITPEKYYEMVQTFKNTLKNDNELKLYTVKKLSSLLPTLNETEIEKEYDELFEIEEKKEFLEENKTTYIYSLYMDGINLKKIELLENDNKATIDFNGDTTTLSIVSTTESNYTDDDFENNSTTQKPTINSLVVINSKKELNINYKDGDDEIIFNWTKGSVFKLESTSDGVIATGTLKIDKSKTNQLLDMTFDIPVENENIKGSIKTENKIIDNFKANIPTNALDIESETTQQSLMEELGANQFFKKLSGSELQENAILKNNEEEDFDF